MTDQFVIYLGSSDSQNVHPANSNTDFIIDLPTQLLLDGNGRWPCWKSTVKMYMCFVIGT